MNKFILVFWIFVFNISAYSQTIVVEYAEKKIMSAERLENMPESLREQQLKPQFFTLTYSNNKSIYKANEIENEGKTIEEKKVVEKQNDDLIEVNTIITSITNVKSQRVSFKDYLKKEMLFTWPNFSEVFLGKDNLQNWNWNITDETKIIEGFTCKKAKSVWLGYEYTAWYTEDIGVAIGPDRFDGLPGLILYLYTPYFEWKAVKVTQNKKQTVIEPLNFEGKKTMTLSEINDSFKSPKPTTTTTQEGNNTITTKKKYY